MNSAITSKGGMVEGSTSPRLTFVWHELRMNVTTIAGFVVLAVICGAMVGCLNIAIELALQEGRVPEGMKEELRKLLVVFSSSKEGPNIILSQWFGKMLPQMILFFGIVMGVKGITREFSTLTIRRTLMWPVSREMVYLSKIGITIASLCIIGSIGTVATAIAAWASGQHADIINEAVFALPCVLLAGAVAVAAGACAGVWTRREGPAMAITIISCALVSIAPSLCRLLSGYSLYSLAQGGARALSDGSLLILPLVLWSSVAIALIYMGIWQLKRVDT